MNKKELLKRIEEDIENSVEKMSKKSEVFCKIDYSFVIRDEFKTPISFKEKKNLQKQFSEFHISQYEIETEQKISLIIAKKEKESEFKFFVNFNKNGYFEISDENNMLNTIEKELDHIEEIQDSIDWKFSLTEKVKNFWYNSVSFEDYDYYPLSAISNYIKE